MPPRQGVQTFSRSVSAIARPSDVVDDDDT
jgi:hypothetical protein